MAMAPKISFTTFHLYSSLTSINILTGTGATNEIGTDDARGTTVNVPAPPYSGDQGYLSAFQSILVPLARRFQPELILLSAGFDGHWLDPLASTQLSITDIIGSLKNCSLYRLNSVMDAWSVP